MTTKFERVLSAALHNPGHDYPEDFAHENGQYMHHCIRKECGEQFTGGKYRFICKKCSTATPGQDVGRPAEIAPV
jgi:hypothetical protein